MSKYIKIAGGIVFFGGLLATLIFYLAGRDIAVLSPAGTIAEQERDLIVTATLLMMIIVVPVFIFTFVIAWRFRESNSFAKYEPYWDHNRGIEVLWWIVPLLIITVLSVMAWNSSHQLDPFKPLDSDKKPIAVQVIALEWKWLFIYPDHDIASVNFVQFPHSTPVNFQITADAPMNSFWIPKLGGQIYAMAGMSTMLHLEASAVGTYSGSSANISGKGFAGMKFTAKSSTQADFEQWVKSAKRSLNHLGLSQYNDLAKPSMNNQAAYYSGRETRLFDMVLAKYHAPGHQATSVRPDDKHQNERL